jgi:hypothetical protein
MTRKWKTTHCLIFPCTDNGNKNFLVEPKPLWQFSPSSLHIVFQRLHYYSNISAAVKVIANWIVSRLVAHWHQPFIPNRDPTKAQYLHYSSQQNPPLVVQGQRTLVKLGQISHQSVSEMIKSRHVGTELFSSHYYTELISKMKNRMNNK